MCIWVNCAETLRSQSFTGLVWIEYKVTVTAQEQTYRTLSLKQQTQHSVRETEVRTLFIDQAVGERMSFAADCSPHPSLRVTSLLKL